MFVCFPLTNKDVVDKVYVQWGSEPHQPTTNSGILGVPIKVDNKPFRKKKGFKGHKEIPGKSTPKTNKRAVSRKFYSVCS